MLCNGGYPCQVEEAGPHFASGRLRWVNEFIYLPQDIHKHLTNFLFYKSFSL